MNSASVQKMDAERNCCRQLKSWHELYQAAVGPTHRDPTSQELTRLAGMFPYMATVGYYREVGKHFVSVPVLEILERIYAAVRHVDRVSLYSVQGTRAQNGAKILLDFLACCLDKHFKVYEYKSYIGLALFLDNTLPMQVTIEKAVERRLNPNVA
jgi:hypothetical protein